MYSYVLLLYVLPEFVISLGAKYTNLSFPFISYFAKLALLYTKYPVPVWLSCKVFITASLVIIGILFITLLFLFISSSVIVPEFSIFSSSIFILYAFFVLSIFFAIYSFSLSNSFEFTNIKSNNTITTNNTTRYAGITTRFFSTLFVFPSLKYFIALNANITIINANITYPHNFTVASVIPAPIMFTSSFIVSIFPYRIFCIFKIVIIAIPIIINLMFLIIFLVNKLSFSILPSIPSKYILNTIT